jgi:folate-binding protein YgfZ
MKTPLQEVLSNDAGSPAVLAEYRGATTAARFTDAQTEFAALHASCGVYDLGFLARTEVTGKDRVRWLNGMVTNNIRDLAVGRGVYAFLLNPQGHIQGDLYAYKLNESILLDTDRAQAEATLSKLKRYIIMDDVKLATLELTAVGVSGPKALEVLGKAGISIPETQPLEIFTPQCSCSCDCLECAVIRGEDAPQETYEVWIAPKDVGTLWKALVAAGGTPVGSEALEANRILRGIPLYGVDIRERELPQETEQARALNFTKGCYIGQEIVERIRSRGNVHRKFTGFVVEGTAKISPGAKIVADEKEVGEITSTITLQVPGSSRTVALGYIRREAGTSGREVMIGEARATVAQMPLDLAAMSEPALTISSARDPSPRW